MTGGGTSSEFAAAEGAVFGVYLVSVSYDSKNSAFDLGYLESRR